MDWFSTAVSRTAVAAYVLVMGALVVRASRRPRSLSEHAVGGRDVSGVIAGLSFAAQLTSVATFLVNPGFVYAYGLSAFYGYALSGPLGIVTGLLLLAGRFRSYGARVRALTVPHWIGARYESSALRVSLSALSMALITFATLIVVALSLLLSELLAVPPHVLAAALTALPAAGVMIGGATGHVWTNTAQVAVMVVVALVLLAAGVPHLVSDPGPIARLAAADPDLVRPVNPGSPYFRSFLEVFVCNFVVGIAVVCQPHVLGKALYLRGRDEMPAFFATACVATGLFSAILVTGVWARLTLPPGLPIDRAMPAWIAATFPPGVQILIALGLLSAGLSTLEGILHALSAVCASDIYPLLTRAPSERGALRAGRAGLAAFALATMALAQWQLDHPTGATVGVFAQYGAYLLLSASFVPLVFGMFARRVRPGAVMAGVASAVGAYLGVALLEITPFHNNPAVLATIAILAGVTATALGSLAPRLPYANT